ncbi:Mechanosensitive (MS) ion channel [hydrothermal vent metagenome]|uniref:Mechanosensitive (MS) ion channel n=1 Tax=hydrothermal vent metagenome TaxID=652676 RepID=A0A3B0TV33_9ZZZZ
MCVFLFFVLRKIIYYILRKLQFRILKKSNENINLALKKLTRPIVLLILIWFIKKIVPSFLLDLDINTILFLALNIMTTVFWIYVFLKLVKVFMSIYADFAESTHNKLDDQLVPILQNFLTGVVIFLGILKLLTLFGVEPAAVIAGASIGGIAVALASQDTVKNLIGTVMIFVDKPFHIGDWIEAGEVVGTVETVGFRSTTVRAADTSVYQIPNSTLSEMVVNNKGLRAFRRYTTNLGLRYDTPPELVEAFVKGVRKIIELHPDTREDAFNVEFTGFGDSALLILVNVYFTALDWSVEQAAKHSLHISILKFAKELGVDFAFPSTTVMIEQFPEKKGLAINYDVENKRIQQIIDNIKNGQ